MITDKCQYSSVIINQSSEATRRRTAPDPASGPLRENCTEIRKFWMAGTNALPIGPPCFRAWGKSSPSNSDARYCRDACSMTAGGWKRNPPGLSWSRSPTAAHPILSQAPRASPSSNQRDEDVDRRHRRSRTRGYLAPVQTAKGMLLVIFPIFLLVPSADGAKHLRCPNMASGAIFR